MTLLNKKAISAAYWRFMGYFVILLGVLVLLAFTFIRTVDQQITLLENDGERYRAALFKQRELAQNVDSLYSDLELLNPKVINSPADLQGRIDTLQGKLKRELTVNSTLRFMEGHPHGVYQKLGSYVNEMVLLKASLREMDTQIKDKTEELSRCQKRLSAN
jgi:predicted PurR-regulated permease PerM